MIALEIERTRPAFPLGQPYDGRDRYGMTVEQAHVYRWLVKHRPHDNTFQIDYRDVATCMHSKPSNIHMRICALIERGWLRRSDTGSGMARYAFVHPVMTFAEPRRG